MKKIDSVKLALKEKSYNVLIGKNLVKNNIKQILSILKGAKKIFIITDSFIKKNHLKKFIRLIPKSFIIETIILTPGETSKQLKCIENILNFLLKKRISRTDIIFGIGGGVIGDISGYVSSIILRGVKLIHFPTTLLAQVDSSIGGKTGVNSMYGKNLIGTFYQPKLVVCDINFLSTLPKREMLAGYAEVIKYSILSDKNFFYWLKKNLNKILSNDPNILQKVIKKSVLIKSKFIVNDEKDLKNKRALLNLGHTYAHALEKSSKYSRDLLHGEAVSIGICMACRLSSILGFLKINDLNEIEKIFLDIGLPTNLNSQKKLKLKKNNIIKNMLYDKKILKGKLNLVLCKGIGKTFIYNKANINSIKKSIY